MEKKSYAELLKDPRWQKKRLEIMQRDNFTCQHCFATDKSLQVHHLVYEKGKKPWEYENDELITLCEDCHQEETEMRVRIYNQFGSLLNQFRMSKFSSCVLADILEYLSMAFDYKKPEDCKYPCEDSALELIEHAVNNVGTKGDLLIASKMGIDVSDYVEYVCPELKDKIIKGGKQYGERR